MNAVLSTPPGADVPVGTLVAIGVALTVVAACLGRFRLAGLLAIPTLLLTGAAAILSWLFGGTHDSDPATPPPAPATTQGTDPADISGSGTHWGAFALTALGVVLIVLGTVVWALWSRRSDSWYTYDHLDENGDEVVYPDLSVGPRPAHGPGSSTSWKSAAPDTDGHDAWPSDNSAHSVGAPEGTGNGAAGPGTTGRAEPREPAATGEAHTSARPPGDVWKPLDNPFLENLQARIDRLAGLYLNAMMPRPGRPARVDLLAPDARYFVSALTTTLDLFDGKMSAARMEQLVEAVREVERRWDAVIGTRIGPSLPGDAETSAEPIGPARTAQALGTEQTDAPTGERPAVPPRHRIRIPPRHPVRSTPGEAENTAFRGRRRPGEHPAGPGRSRLGPGQAAPHTHSTPPDSAAPPTRPNPADSPAPLSQADGPVPPGQAADGANRSDPPGDL
ncbi:hypothetical protein MXD62_12570 [Frankia sp. Mgl5]|uniref:hypothetical protein n=1 Tax=Frankia sp. Mgl5 TaxID=2933793 RepID=UPI00200F4D2E|nr:hypothetical protein [Frankia sp. Mgl5]MCK9927997.1 hypothetical protein [Frankia sp. Mgl5]